jgi:hypothetical protein
MRWERGVSFMPVSRIERIISGTVVGCAVVGPTSGKYHCHRSGSNMSPLPFDTLDDVADFLRANPGSGVRMAPSFSKIVNNIYIDGFRR